MKANRNTIYLKNIFLNTIILLVSINLSSQTVEKEKTAKKFNFSGSIDAYFRANLNAANSGENYVAPSSSFAQLPGFALGMANIIGAYEGEKVGFVADLVYGPRGTDATFASPMYSATGNIINQLYAYWNVSETITLTFGNFNTFLGYEVISPVGNFNYSTSYLFSYGPFSHTGLKADFALSDDFSLMLSVMNETDFTEFNPTGKYTYGVQLGYTSQYFNLLMDNGSFEIDYTGGFDISDSFFLGINAAYFNGDEEDGIGNFAGIALYPQLTTSENFSIGLRGEYFTETDGFGAIGASPDPNFDGDMSVFAITLTANATIGDLTIKPELRLDSATEDVFVNSDGEVMAGLSSFVLAAVYSF